MYCVRNSVLSGWFLLYAFGLATYSQPVFVVPCVLAGAIAVAVFRWTEPPSELAYPRAIRRGHAVLAAVAVAAAVLGLAAASTALSRGADPFLAVFFAPLAAFFLGTAILAWRALVAPTPRRTAAIPVVVYLGWLPCAMVVPWPYLLHGVDGGWQAVAIPIALWTLIAVGGLLSWIATLATTEPELPVAHLRR